MSHKTNVIRNVLINRWRRAQSTAIGVSWRLWCGVAIFIAMSDVTRILSQIEAGDPQAAERLLPLVYDELRKLAAAKLAQERPGQTLQATALVHEAYVRLVVGQDSQSWENRGHFFAAAAQAMRRILVEIARKKQRIKHGGEFMRVADVEHEAPADRGDVVALDEALNGLAAEDPLAAKV